MIIGYPEIMIKLYNIEKILRIQLANYLSLEHIYPSKQIRNHLLLQP